MITAQDMIERAAGIGADGRPPDSSAVIVGPRTLARSISEFTRADPLQDRNELIKYRFLCRGGGMLFVGPTGIGKSAWCIQAAIKWALGKEHCGFVPFGPLKSLIIQAENDDDDIAEFRDGVLAGMSLTPAEKELVRQNVVVACEDSLTGLLFLTETVERLLKEHVPDLLWIDPALSYLGADASSQKDVSAFLRNGLNPYLRRYNCGGIVICHPPKPSTGRGNKPLNATELAYSALGSVEWANWARSIVVITPTAGFDVFRLSASKRGQRLRWKDQAGKQVFEKAIAHSNEPGIICWHEANEEERSSAATKQTKTLEDLLALVPPTGSILKNFLIDINAPKAGIGQKKARAFLDQLVKDCRLFLWRQPRPNTGPLISVSRECQPLEPPVSNAPKVSTSAKA